MKASPTLVTLINVEERQPFNKGHPNSKTTKAEVNFHLVYIYTIENSTMGVLNSYGRRGKTKPAKH
jgi:hypothetical protein